MNHLAAYLQYVYTFQMQNVISQNA